MNWKTTLTAAATALAIVGGSAYAQPMQPGSGPGPGYGPMHGTQGSDDSIDRAGRGQWGDSGQRGGWGDHMGPGMMGGWGGQMGPGMMGGLGGQMGPGMMGGYGPPVGDLDLSDSQRQQVRKIEDETRRKNWELMGRMQDEMARQRDAWDGSQVDRGALRASNKRMFELRQQMLENRLDAHENIEGVLTPQQREQLERRTRSWRGGGN